MSISSDSQIVILGGSGFIGAALSTALRDMSGVSVQGYTSSDFDLTDSGCVGKLCGILNRDTILIVTARNRRAADPFSTFSGDVAIATNVARCLEQAGAKKIVYFSSTFVYGDAATDLSITEETRIGTSSLYGIAKFTGECILRHVTEKAGVPMVVLRPCMVYGPGDTSQAYGPARFLDSIMREGKVRVFGDGSERRDYLFIRDLAQIVGRFVSGDHVGTYNLATGRSHSFQDLIVCLRSLVPAGFEVVQVDRDRPKADQRLNPAKLLGVMPDLRFTELKDGMMETYRYVAAQFSASASRRSPGRVLC